MDFHRYPKEYDVIVIGAGHAGCEASLAPARMGMKTLTLTVSLDHVAFMPCNPSLGGPGKSHIVREIDALGGEMAKNMDETMIQIRMLNTSKGPAVHGLRGQSDKDEYHKRMKQVLEQEDNIDLKQQIAEDIVVEDGEVKGVVTKTGVFFPGKKVILTTGTFLKGRIIIGEAKFNAGPNQQYPANKLSGSLKDLGINLRRFKTGTPPRVSKKSMDFSKMEPQPGEEGLSFSFESEPLTGEQAMCYLTYTSEETHRIINDNKMRTPLFSGVIDGVGPRYCPSIEDKVVRFPDKGRHQLFIEPEGLGTDEYYVSGLSTSLPYDVQIEMARTVPGLENVEIMRPGYAIEYDCVDPEELKLDLELKKVKGLYTAGQINGSSGYEEAAGQGLIAGINAALSLQDKEPVILKRSQAYIGVLIDDLVTKGTPEPYRIMTSRAEYRLLLRQDNADQRLTPLGREIGLVSDQRYENYQEKMEGVKKALGFLRADENQVNPTKEVRARLEELGSGNLSKPVSLEKLLRRPEISYSDLKFFAEDLPEIKKDVQEQVEIQVKYKGYIERQEAQVEQFRKMEEKKIPEELDYNQLDNLRLEAREKLNKIRPLSIGQASRISGVSPADISALMIYLEQYNRTKKDDQNGEK
ncbi:tRNA uridine 5-carboxymethylaminomethyl modification enzyme [Halanaerobium saccharolyticum]|jgi:tRNA uridine 5-carboxymethylaminomethyl modification enzyme|uniref:tRNA uridine 5-carboxymethylaminomethyl modification enzyme MnmG n=2 Tax=Halanaerobium TaxID=2330 RepID=A0A2T5RI71_9FIRM|nr:tRNA uridine-5-carboxymethylaminomethyl(34) synthesis enzyme MnmG [Halanaerobium saccharolyticum]PTV97912.1 tRNA uridine 5-carboxymethylaminomethyl modification enzyme [Halanaerobium saccharolyticum]TDP96006.1 tRNA uridine 5-carboxymethylaminomethyl modification enzyme [Halanaerobium saccharolyticum]